MTARRRLRVAPGLFTGVRPSSGAATCSSSSALDHRGELCLSGVSAPEDGALRQTRTMGDPNVPSLCNSTLFVTAFLLDNLTPAVRFVV